MKILTVVWNLFDGKSKELEVSRNGGSIMIYNICEYIGRKVDSYLFTGSVSIEECDYNHIHVVSNGKYLPENKKDIKKWQDGLRKRFIEVLSELKPDYILIQGGGEFTYNCIKICEAYNIEFSFVDHLYIGKERAQKEDKEPYEWEKKALEVKNIRIVVVGKAMRDEIIKDYPNLEENIYVIPNGTPFNGELCKSKLVYQYELKGKKVLLCSGSLHPRKNQMQLIQSFNLIPAVLREKIVVLFCGKDSIKIPMKDKMLKEISDKGFDDALKYIGVYPMEKMKEVYSLVDGVVMPSLYEGLSLVAIEMLTYGKPVIMFSDNETAGDVNDPKAVVFANDHSDQALADAIVEWYERDWDEEYIKEYSRYFKMERVADEYIEYCRQRIEESN